MPTDSFPYIPIPKTGQKYFLSGDNPELLIVSGTHGDESEIIPLVENVVWEYRHRLPPFLFVPEISPSASKLKTRNNKDNLDLNRSFITPPPTEEVGAMMALWSKYSFDVFLTFHTDPEFTDFYLYEGTRDEDYEKQRLYITSEWSLLKRDVTSFGVGLYNGIDDPEDPVLGYTIKDGYAYWPMSTKINDHASEYWLITEARKARQVINPEIPGKATLGQKAEIIKAVIRRLILGETE